MILVIRGLLGAGEKAAASQTVIRPDPLLFGLKPAAQDTISVVVENVHNLYALEIHLAFDPHVLEVMDADPVQEGVQIEPAEWWENGFVAVNRVDNSRGRIDFAATLLNPALPVSGDQTIAVITFHAREAGDSELSIEAAILSTREAVEIPYITRGGSISVNPGGQAAEVRASDPSPSPVNRGLLALAGLSVLAFISALGVFLHTLRRGR